MTFVWILIGILAGLLLLGAAPLTVSITYKSGDFVRVKAGVPPIMLSLYPDPETELEDESLTLTEKRALLKKLEKNKAKKAKKAAKKAAKKKTSPKKDEKAEGTAPQKKKKSAKRNIRFLIRFVSLLLKRTGERTTVTVKRCYLTVGSKDAAETAYLYGTLSASVAYLLAIIDVHTKKEPSRKHIGVYADFTADKITADIALTLKIRLFSALKLALQALWQYMNRNSKTPSTSVQKG